MSSPKSIGILGGVGAIASARFHLDLVTRWAEIHDARTDDDFPVITHISRSLCLGAEGLRNASLSCQFAGWVIDEMPDCDRIAVVCNSIAPVLPIDPRILTPVAACADVLAHVKTAWLLASESSVRDRIYQGTYPDIDWKVPSQPITPIIERLVATGTYDQKWRRAIEDEIPDDEVIVLGCTELSTQPSPFLHHKTISPTDEMIKLLCNTSH